MHLRKVSKKHLLLLVKLTENLWLRGCGFLLIVPIILSHCKKKFMMYNSGSHLCSYFQFVHSHFRFVRQNWRNDPRFAKTWRDEKRRSKFWTGRANSFDTAAKRLLPSSHSLRAAFEVSVICYQIFRFILKVLVSFI